MARVIGIILAFFLLSACTTLKKPFLYEAKKASNSMYLFGTIHLGVPIQDVPAVVMDKFNQSQRFDMEVDSNNLDVEKKFAKDLEKTTAEIYAILNSLHKNNPEAAGRLGKRLHADYLKHNQPLPAPERKLSQRLTPKAWNYTRAYLKQMDLETLEKISPNTIGKFVLEFESPMVEATPAWFARMDPKYSMDLNFQSRAREQGKDIYQLDDTEVLTQSCSDLMVSAQIEASFDKKDPQELVKVFSDLEKSYRSGEETEVVKYSTMGGPELMACMIDERNRKWIPLLIDDSEGAAMRGQPPLFVAVGTAHLFGPQGLIELLKKEGYSVQRIDGE